jgi:hypothetical protein
MQLTKKRKKKKRKNDLFTYGPSNEYNDNEGKVKATPTKAILIQAANEEVSKKSEVQESATLSSFLPQKADHSSSCYSIPDPPTSDDALKEEILTFVDDLISKLESEEDEIQINDSKNEEISQYTNEEIIQFSENSEIQEENRSLILPQNLIVHDEIRSMVLPQKVNQIDNQGTSSILK